MLYKGWSVFAKIANTAFPFPLQSLYLQGKVAEEEKKIEESWGEPSDLWSSATIKCRDVIGRLSV